jgi:hypothetical protein
MAFVALPPIEFDDPYEPLYLDLADQGFGRHEGLGAIGEHPMTAAELPQPDKRLMARWGQRRPALRCSRDRLDRRQPLEPRAAGGDGLQDGADSR